MARFWIGLTVFALAFLLIFGCAQEGGQPPAPQSNQQSVPPQSGNVVQASADPFTACYSNSAQKLTSCLIKTSVETGNESICKYSIGTRYACECFLQMSEKKGAGVCDSYVYEYKGQTTSMANDCYTYLAAKKKQESTCDYIKSTTDKANCIAIAQRNTGLCPKGSTNCIGTIAFLEMNPQLCAPERLNFTCITNIAIAKKDQSICNLLDNTQKSWGGSDQKSCINAVATNLKLMPPLSFSGCYEELYGVLEK